MQYTPPETENLKITDDQAASANAENVASEQAAPIIPRRSRMARRSVEASVQESAPIANIIQPTERNTLEPITTPQLTPETATVPEDASVPDASEQIEAQETNQLLMPCPACKKEISKAVRRCPFCGHPIKKVNTKKLLVVIAAIALSMLIAGGAYYFFVYMPKQIPIKAHEYLLQGDFISADKMYARLGNSEENLLLREQLYYESRIIQAAKAEQENLIFPDTMLLSEVVIWENEITDTSSEGEEVYTYSEPEFLLHYLAQSKGGSMVDGYVKVYWENGSYVANGSYSDLEDQDTLPWYIDDSTPQGAQEALEFWAEQLGKSKIRLELLSRPRIGTFDIDRCNEIIKASCGKTSNLIPAGGIIITPSPCIIEITPKP